MASEDDDDWDDLGQQDWEAKSLLVPNRKSNVSKQESRDRTAVDVKTLGKPLKYPKQVFFIVGNEFCERFSYYGMRTVLTLYLNEQLGFSENDSTVIYSTFSMLCYFTPLFGAMIADSLLGKFRTIFYISIIYAIGNVVLSLAAVPNALPSVAFTMIGLILIAVGTGGIKPCVSAFGGDQFVVPQQEKQLQRFFSIFYFSINAGSLISTFMTPVMRQDQCLGMTTCYPLAFGVPAVLMIISLGLFLLGAKWYVKFPAQGNVAVQGISLVKHAIANKWRHRSTYEKKEHWLDWADDKFDKTLISDVRELLSVLYLYLPLPIFWALYDQQGSRWTFQARRMDGTLGNFTLQPDQIQVINPLLILLFIPVFESGIYPLLNKCFILRKPLQRMAVGGMLAALAFVISGVLEMRIEALEPVTPSAGQGYMNFVNTLPCDVTVHPHFFDDSTSITIGSHAQSDFIKNIKVNTSIEDKETYSVTLNAPANCFGTSNSYTSNETITVFNGQARTVVIGVLQGSTKPVLQLVELSDQLTRTGDCSPHVRVLYSFDSTSNWTVNIKSSKGNQYMFSTSTPYLGGSAVQTLTAASYDVHLLAATQSSHMGNVILKPGGSYSLLVVENSTFHDAALTLLTLTEPNSINMLWQFPQYIVITAAEIMFSITGLEFSYTQAPPSMKSVVTAGWQLTTAFGDLIIVVITSASILSRQSMEFFLFAFIMCIDIAVFIFMSYTYTYKEGRSKTRNEENEGRELHVTNQLGLANEYTT